MTQQEITSFFTFKCSQIPKKSDSLASGWQYLVSLCINTRRDCEAVASFPAPDVSSGHKLGQQGKETKPTDLGGGHGPGREMPDLGRTWGFGPAQGWPPWRVQLTGPSTPGLVFLPSSSIFPVAPALGAKSGQGGCWNPGKGWGSSGESQPCSGTSYISCLALLLGLSQAWTYRQHQNAVPQRAHRPSEEADRPRNDRRGEQMER